MIEVWKDIEGYEGLYQVSNLGRVKSLNNKEEKILKQQCYNGYLYVGLYLNKKLKYTRVHRLVAMAFISNPSKYPHINHKDCNPKNNTVDNLEWCDCKYNINYGDRNKKVSEKMTNGKESKSVIQKSLDGQIIAVWPSMNEAQRNGFDEGAVSRCCNKIWEKYKGFKWEYAS